MYSLLIYLIYLKCGYIYRFLAQQEVTFDWTAKLTGTGDRSEFIKTSY